MLNDCISGCAPESLMILRPKRIALPHIRRQSRILTNPRSVQAKVGNLRTTSARVAPMFTHIRRLLFALVAPFAIVTTLPLAQTLVPNAQQSSTHANILRGEYGRYRANNDLLFYHLDVRVDPQKKVISGKNTIRFRMLQDDTRI